MASAAFEEAVFVAAEMLFPAHFREALLAQAHATSG